MSAVKIESIQYSYGVGVDTPDKKFILKLTDGSHLEISVPSLFEQGEDYGTVVSRLEALEAASGGGGGTVDVTTLLLKSANLSDVANKPTALTNLGFTALGKQLAAVANQAALQALVGTDAALAARVAAIEALGSLATDAELIAAVASILGSADAAGDTLGELETLITARLLKTNNLSDLTSVAAALTNLGFTNFAAGLRTAVDAAAFRTAIGARAATITLGTYKAARALVATQPLVIAAMGHSVVEGYGASTKATRWQDLALTRLRTALGLAAGGEGYVSANYASPNIGPRFVFTGTVTAGSNSYGSTRFGPGVRHMKLAAAATASLTFTGTGIDFLFPRGPGTSTYNITIDGGAAGTTYNSLFNGSTGWANGYEGNRHKVRGLAPGTHTVTLTAVANYTFLEGAFVYNGDENSGVQWWDAAHSGYRALDMEDPYTDGMWADINPHLLYIEFMANEYQQAVVSKIPPKVAALHVRKRIDDVRRASTRNCSVIIGVTHEMGQVTTPVLDTWQAYRDALYDLGNIVSDVSYLEIENAIGKFVNAGSQYDSGDQKHPNDAGHNKIADLVVAALTA